jgi:glycerol uptake facilitator-like aquaporin
MNRRLAAEALGTAFLLATVVGSGIMGERLADGNVALALLANAVATGAVLAALILTFGQVSGAHFNPAVILAMALQRAITLRAAAAYIVVQILAAVAGVAAAHLMFGEPVLAASLRERSGAAQWWSEGVATFGLVAVVLGCVRSRPEAVGYAVGAYITGAHWFAASTSFANPAVTIARAATDTFSGIRPIDVPSFVLAQLAGACLAALVMSWLHAKSQSPGGR